MQWLCVKIIGAVHKGRSQSGGCPVQTYCGQGGSLDADVRTF